jgi:hypothetical protein
MDNEEPLDENEAFAEELFVPLFFLKTNNLAARWPAIACMFA